MDTLQDIRYKLQKRITRLQGLEPTIFSTELIRFWDYFDGNATLIAIANELVAKFPKISEEVDQMQRHSTIHGLTEGESAAIGYSILRKVATTEPGGLSFMEFVRFGGSLDATLQDFRQAYLEPFYEFVDEQLQDSNLILAQLIRFKHLAEWFRRKELWDVFTQESHAGERRLAFKVYEYLCEQGITFSIEPTSASGEADMIGIQDGKNPLVADVKIFDPLGSRGTGYIRKGFHQVYRYLQDFNKPVGYLVVFKVAEKNLRVEGAEGEIPRIQVGNKTIFMVEVDIFPHQESASRRGVSEEEVVFTANIGTEMVNIQGDV
jgi:hypothetical protein